MVSESNFCNFFQSVWEQKHPNPKQTNKKSFSKKEFNWYSIDWKSWSQWCVLILKSMWLVFLDLTCYTYIKACCTRLCVASVLHTGKSDASILVNPWVQKPYSYRVCVYVWSQSLKPQPSEVHYSINSSRRCLGVRGYGHSHERVVPEGIHE